MIELGFAAFLLAHGGIHISFIAPAPPEKPGAPKWSFDLTRSWILTRYGISKASLRLIGFALVAVILGGYALGALGVLGVLPPEATLVAIVLASIASLVLLTTFFHPWLVMGVGIDIALVWLALTRALPA